jgi:hypothetical protein
MTATAATPVTMDDLESRYGIPGNRNAADRAGIESAIKPFASGNSGINITPNGQIISPNSPEMAHISAVNPLGADKLSKVQDINRSFWFSWCLTNLKIPTSFRMWGFLFPYFFSFFLFGKMYKKIV